MTEGGTGGTPHPPEEEWVARLLAEAGGPLTMPGPVVARLDGVLAELAAERGAVPIAAAGEGVGVDELQARRRRWPRVLLAAAAVVIGGYGVATVATQGSLSGSDGDATSASDFAGGSTSGLGQDQDEALGGAGAPEAVEDRARLSTSMIRIRSTRFEAGALRAVRVLQVIPQADSSELQLRSDCPPPETGSGERPLRVRYDGTAAVLVAGPQRGGTVEVTVYDCAGQRLDGALVRP